MSKNLRRLFFYFGYLFFFWGAFRYFVKLPEVIEELWFKPVIWLSPLVWWRLMSTEKSAFFAGKFSSGLVWGLIGGVIYLLIMVVYLGIRPTLELNGVGVALATAVVEELTFSGFILNMLVAEFKNENIALFLTATVFALIHLPIGIFVHQLGPILIGAMVVLAFFVNLIDGFLSLRSKTLASAIVAHFVYLLIIL